VWREDHQTHWHKKFTIDLNKTVNIWEAFYLGAALGVDDFAEAIGLGVAGFPVALTVFFFKLSEVIMISAGMYLAYQGMAVNKFNERIKYIPGIILIGVGIKQLF
jgi:putative Mn2+ efflux pump MntP